MITPSITSLKGRSLSVLSVAAACPADFRTSATPRLMPRIRFFRIFQSVKQAPTSIPPTAIGLTIYR